MNLLFAVLLLPSSARMVSGIRGAESERDLNPRQSHRVLGKNKPGLFGGSDPDEVEEDEYALEKGDYEFTKEHSLEKMYDHYFVREKGEDAYYYSPLPLGPEKMEELLGKGPLEGREPEPDPCSRPLFPCFFAEVIDVYTRCTTDPPTYVDLQAVSNHVYFDWNDQACKFEEFDAPFNPDRCHPNLATPCYQDTDTGERRCAYHRDISFSHLAGLPLGSICDDYNPQKPNCPPTRNDVQRDCTRFGNQPRGTILIDSFVWQVFGSWIVTACEDNGVPWENMEPMGGACLPGVPTN